MDDAVHRRFLAVILIVLAVALRGTIGLAFVDDSSPQEGPSFVVEPPSRVEFTNDTGAVISCSARGRPPPRISWTHGDGRPLGEGAEGARRPRPDGALSFPPFAGEAFRQGVHDAAYRCTASNVVGVVVSREVHVKAVVRRRYKVQVYDEFVVRGNTAVLRCQVPAFVRGQVDFAWRTGDGQAIGPATPTTGGRYSVLSGGELHIRSAGVVDGQRQYACEARHRLTGEGVASATAASLFVTEPHGTSSPKVIDYRPMVSASEGDTLELACAATAFPPPTYRWFRETEGRLLPLGVGPRTALLEGSLFLQFVRVPDSGRYACVANNSAGEDRAFTLLTVTAPLSVYVTPPLQVVEAGRPAHLNCSASGHPVRALSWLRDGRPLGRGEPRLTIQQVGRDDAGMYQCFAYNDYESAHGSAEVRLGDVAPVLLSTFSSENVHPGTSVSLRCTASGNPLPQVTWYLDDHSVPDALARLRVGDFVTAEGHVVSHVNVTDARAVDGGEYACAARNAVGVARHSARLDVQGPPLVRPMHDATAVAGREVALRCPFAGYPIEEVIWKKDGATLPTNHRQRLEGAGRLVIQDVERSADEGTYSCEAVGPDNRRAEGSMHMTVLVPPVIDPVLLPPQLTAEEGRRARVMCSVTQGDPPLRIEWRRDGLPLPSEDEDLSSQGLEDSSLLVFRRARADHSANYTCEASNAAGVVNRTTRLVVNVPPRWSVEPANAFAVDGQTIVMDCVAEGHPAPDVHWKKAAGSIASDFREVTSSYRRQVFENGSLALREVSEPDAGHYLCQATNGVGAGLSKVVTLKVHTPPRFETKFVSYTVSRGNDAELRCEATGEPRIRITWEKDKQPLDPDALKRLQAVEESSPRATTSRLVVLGATRSDSALYTCTASSEFGRDETNMQLVVQEPPAPPSDLTVREKSSRTVTLNWSPTFSGNSPVLHYVVQYRNATDGGEEVSSVTFPGTEVGGVVRGLLPANGYSFRVLAENTLGQSEPSQFITVTTDEEVPGGPPLDVEVQPTGSQSLKVTWKPPREDLRHGPITGYYIGYRPSDSADPFQYKNVEAGPGARGGLSYLTNLRRLTRYAVIVQAYNAAGAGPRSDEVAATTLEAAPPTSPVLAIQSVTSSSLTVTWDRPQDDTGVREYVLHYKADGGGGAWLERRLRTGGSRHTLEGLRCGTGYRLYVTATNSLGTGEPGGVLAARTAGAAPLSPQRDSFLTVNATSATLHFGAWQSGGCPILHYSVHRRHQGQWEALAERVDAHQPQMDVRHLAPNREYTLRVSAHSEAGTTEAEYRFNTPNVTAATVSAPKGAGGGVFPPALPFHRNLALLLPVVISVAVLLIVLITVIVCMRRQIDGNSEDSRKGRSLEQLGLSEFPRKGSSKEADAPSSYGGPKSSYYSSPARKPVAHARDLEGGNHEYAEPYSAVPVPIRLPGDSPSLPLKATRPQSDGSYATVKRSPTRGHFATSGQVVDLCMVRPLSAVERSAEHSSSSSEGYNRQFDRHNVS